MSVSLNAGVGPRLTAIIQAVAQAFGVNIASAQSPAFRMTIETNDGQNSRLRFQSLDQGNPSVAVNAQGISDNSMVQALSVPTGVTGTLAAGVKDIALANVSGDQLSVVLVTSGGTPGVLSVKRKDAATVTVQSWLAGTGIQTADTSVVKVFNFGQVAI